MNGNECQLKSGVLSKSGQINLKHEVLSQLYKDYNNFATSISTQQQLNRQCTYDHVKYTMDFKTGINVNELNNVWVYFMDKNMDKNNVPVYYDIFEPIELTVQPGSGWSIFVLDISLPQGTVGARVAGIFGGSSSSYGGDKCNRGHVPAEIIMETWGSCPVIEDLPLGVSVVAMGQTATNQKVGGMKVYNLTKLDEGETELPLSQSPFKDNESTDLMLVAMEKLLESEKAIKEDPFSKWDIACDNIFGADNLLCDKTYTVKSGFTQSWTTEHGFDLSVTIGTSFEADAFFASVTTSFELLLGYSFTSSYTKSKKEEVSESFQTGGRVPAGAKMEIRFFKSDIPVKVKWRASIFADGYVLIMLVDPVTGYSLMDKPKLLHLSQLLSYDERKLFAFGTINYGKRTTLTARTKVIDRDGNVISSDEENKPVNAGSINF